MADTTRVVRIVVDARGAQQGSSQVTSALERIDRQRQRTQSGLQALAAANDSASARMIAGMSAVNNASLRMIEGMSRAGQAANLLDRQIGVAANTNRRFGSAIQQAGFQVGDFAVQVASGQGALRAFIQQGTQLISMFGPWGAVIGAAGAVVGALAIGLGGLGDETDAVAIAAERAEATQDALNRTMGDSVKSAEDLTEKYAALSAEMRAVEEIALVGALRRINEEQDALRESARAAVEDLAALVSTVKAPLVTLGRPSTRPEDIAVLERQRAIAEALDRFGREQNVAQLAIDLGDVARESAEVGSALGGVLDTLVDNAKRFDELATQQERVAAMQRLLAGTATEADRALLDVGTSAEGTAKKVGTFADVLADLNQKAIVQEAKEYADAIKLIERTIESGMTDQERYEQQVLAINRALEIAAKRGWQLSAENAERLNRALKEADPAFRAAKEAAEKAQRERERMAEREAELIRRPFENALEGIQDSFTDFFEDVFRGGIDSFKDLASGIKSIFVRLAAEIAALLVFRPVVAGILGGVGLGSIAGGMGLLPTSGGLPGGVGIGDLFGVGKEFLGSGSGISQWLFGAAQNGKILPTSGWLGSGGQFLGSTFLAEAFLPGLGALLPGLIGGNVKQAGLGLGGALLGTAIGGPIGGVVGGLLGNVLGDLFGGKKGIPQVTQNLLFQGGQLVPGEPWSANNGGSMVAGTRTLGQSVADAVNQIVADLGGSILEGATGGYVKVKQTGKGTRYFAGLGSYGSGISLGAGDDPQAIAGLVISGILQEAARAGNLTGVSDSVLTVLNQGKVTKGSVRSLEQLNADLAFAQIYDQLTGLAPETTEAAEAIKALRKEFADARKEASRLGLDLEKLSRAEAQAIAKLTTDFNKSISDQILGLTDPLALALQQLEEAQAARLKEAKALGADLVQVERLTALERQKVVEQFGGSLRSFFDEITFGRLSGAAPGASLEGARAAFEAAAAQGNIAGIETYGRAYLESARAFYASGTGFQEALARVQSVVGSHVAGNDNQAVVSSLNSGFGNLSSQMNALITINAGLRQDNAELRAEIRSLLDRLQALAA